MKVLATAAAIVALIAPAHHRHLPCHGFVVRDGGGLTVCPGMRPKDR